MFTNRCAREKKSSCSETKPKSAVALAIFEKCVTQKVWILAKIKKTILVFGGCLWFSHTSAHFRIPRLKEIETGLF